MMTRSVLGCLLFLLPFDMAAASDLQATYACMANELQRDVSTLSVRLVQEPTPVIISEYRAFDGEIRATTIRLKLTSPPPHAQYQYTVDPIDIGKGRRLERVEELRSTETPNDIRPPILKKAGFIGVHCLTFDLERWPAFH